MILSAQFSLLAKKDDKFWCFHKDDTNGHDSVPCMKYSCYERIQCSTTVRLKSTEKLRFYSRRLGPPRLEPQPTLSVHALGPRAPAHHFPVRSAQPTFFSLSSGAIRTVHHALQLLTAVRSLLRRSSFFPHCFLANALYLHGSLHTTPPPTARFPLLLPPTCNNGVLR
jgi:hypothetical protein